MWYSRHEQWEKGQEYVTSENKKRWKKFLQLFKGCVIVDTTRWDKKNWVGSSSVKKNWVGSSVVGKQIGKVGR